VVSDRLTEFKRILDEASETTSRWNSMKADLERCRQKIERLRGELTWANDPAAAMELLTAIRFIDYTAHQYQSQLERFPGKLAEIRQKCLSLALSPAEAHQVSRRGGLN
jgi:chromosome segregation ATPase